MTGKTLLPLKAELHHQWTEKKDGCQFNLNAKTAFRLEPEENSD